MDVRRLRHLRRLTLLLRESPVVALLGARQIGKTTLARQLAAAARMTVDRCRRPWRGSAPPIDDAGPEAAHLESDHDAKVRQAADEGAP